MVPVSSYVPGDTVVFNFVGNFSQAFLSLNAATVMVQVWGAQGGAARIPGVNGPGALGGYARGTLAVTHDSYRVFVGGKGQDGGSWLSVGGGGGGGATDVRPGNVSDVNTLSARVIVAGGGGGSSYNDPHGGLGVGGGARGGAGVGYAQSGANSTHGGLGWGLLMGSFGSAGFQGCVSDPSAAGGWNGGGCGGRVGGGGGGWYGGGPGGGGGSGYLSSQLLDSTMLSGVRAGNGLAVVEILTTT
jgi:hypothetical protein